ncbi:allophanate hydrolase [Leucothrix sargassi]|nr:allophanate hydrolase [Leucothrix sargassi]
MDLSQLNMTISGIHAAYREKAFTPDTLVDALLEKSEQYLDRNIWISRLSREQIQPYLDKLAEQSIDDLPLYGVPFAIKDNIDLANIPTTAGCKAFSYTPEDDAYVVAQFIAAGAIPMGKTNLDQFATGLVGVRSPWGATGNSFNPEYISGGSSAGSSVAVALGLVTFSLGTDTAGSGRVPAMYNNIVGLKPSIGLLSATGVVPACKTLDCVSIFALTTDDANTVFNVGANFDANDAYARPNTDTNKNNYGTSEQSFTFAIPQEDQLAFFGNEYGPQCFKDSVKALEAIGGVSTTIDFSAFLEAAKLLYEGPWVAERRVATQDVDRADMLPVLQEILAVQADASADDLFSAQYKLQAYYQQVQPILDSFDFLLTPTAGNIYTIADVEANPIQLNSNNGYYTNFMNLLDCSAIAMPTGFMGNDLPFGVTLFSKAFRDTSLLSYANRLQQSLKLPLGATGHALPDSIAPKAGVTDTMDVVVCGAHLEGLPLNWQLTERGGKLLKKTTSADKYRLFALAGGPPFRPGMVRDEANGTEIEVEVWRLPTASFGSFVAGIPEPLGIGKVELADGTWCSGFICEGYALESAQDISKFGGWRGYLEQSA